MCLRTLPYAISPGRVETASSVDTLSTRLRFGSGCGAERSGVSSLTYEAAGELRFSFLEALSVVRLALVRMSPLRASEVSAETLEWIEAQI